MFERLNEQMEIFDCIIEIEIGNKKKIQRMQAPRIILEQQFEQIVQQAANNNAPIRVKMSRNAPMYNQIDNDWIDREASIIYSNNAWIRMEEN